MAFRFFAVPDGITSTAEPPTLVARYKAVETSSQSFVHAYALGATPALASTIYGTLHRQDIRVQKLTYNQYSVEIPYGRRRNQTGQWTWDFDTTGGTVHITNGKAERRYPADTAPDQKAAIGVNGDTVDGTDIVIPATKINVQFKHPLGVITLPQVRFLSSITGTVSSTPFLGYAPGEVLFLGARGADGSEAEATVSYQFAMSANASGLSFGSIANVAKKGWEVLWIRYQESEETADSVVHPVRVPQFAYVDRVYDETDLATALGFGG